LREPTVRHIPRGFSAYLADEFQASKGAAPKLFTTVFIGDHTTEPLPLPVQSTLYTLFLRIPPFSYIGIPIFACSLLLYPEDGSRRFTSMKLYISHGMNVAVRWVCI
jgi:hypothetical protein